MIVIVEQQNTNTRLQAEYILLTRQSQARAILILREIAGEIPFSSLIFFNVLAIA